MFIIFVLLNYVLYHGGKESTVLYRDGKGSLNNRSLGKHRGQVLKEDKNQLITCHKNRLG